MFDDVPEPVWNTSIGNCVVVRAAGDLVGRGRDRVADPPIDVRHVGQPALTRAASPLINASARISARSTGRPEIGKFSTARCVCAPQQASTGTRTSPIESCSTRYSRHDTSGDPREPYSGTRPLP